MAFSQKIQSQTLNCFSESANEYSDKWSDALVWVQLDLGRCTLSLYSFKSSEVQAICIRSSDVGGFRVTKPTQGILSSEMVFQSSKRWLWFQNSPR